MYVYVVTTPAGEMGRFDNELSARNCMKDIFMKGGAWNQDNSSGPEFDKAVEDMEFFGDAAMGGGDSFWRIDGDEYSIVCHDE